MAMKPFLNHQMLKQVLAGGGAAIPAGQNVTPGGVMNTPVGMKPPFTPPPAPQPGVALGKVMRRIFGHQANQTGGTY